MANGFDRLERLFTSKRKASREISPNGRSGPTVAPPTQQFPSPSFIRPKMSRMTARQEVCLRQTTKRSPSVPDVRAAPRVDHGQKLVSVSADGRYPAKHRLTRLPSLNHDQTETLMSALHDFQFPRPPNRNGASPAPSKHFHDEKLAQTPRLPKSRCRSPLDISIPSHYRLDTPPSSDPEDNDSYSPSPIAKASQMISLPARLPTPEQSPEVGFAPESCLTSVQSAGRPGNALLKALEEQLAEPFDRRSLEKTCSHSSIAQSAGSFCSSTLREPDFHEFLSLSDDDIAESRPNSPILAPMKEVEPDTSVPEDLWISSSEPLNSRLLTLTPPRASRPAAAAAFEAARIARRYDFDLVYVVNLWPNTSCTLPRQTPMAIQKPMMGRLLAAHGLHHVPSPLEISEEVHATILRSDGWVEYRDQEALPHDIARGYACAFHTGQYAPSGSPRCAGPVSGVRLSERVDRGIVFAAYRKPRRGTDKLGRTFSDVELGELHRDAEVLVEMVIDIHVANKNRPNPCRNFSTDDIGPIPTKIRVA
ncbi:hypothetical protein E4U42_001120 [Claviceps africana]|uniref:Uncharacterized protein n=1 Tax=Claviceps africana TaxID=83212 RepID=A0A8K0NFB4_9HYPO|nr:hypothetical protein E4U42_001120 [Claviceps africana]